MSRKFELYNTVKIVMKALRETNILLCWSKYSRRTTSEFLKAPLEKVLYP